MPTRTGTWKSSANRGAERHGILAAIRLRLSNGRLEALNSKIRLVSHHSFGFHSAAVAGLRWSESTRAALVARLLAGRRPDQHAFKRLLRMSGRSWPTTASTASQTTCAPGQRAPGA